MLLADPATLSTTRPVIHRDKGRMPMHARGSTMMRTFTFILLAGLTMLLLACSSSGEQGEVALSPSSTSAGNPQPVSRAAVQYNGEESIEERIIQSDAIVIARLDRVTTGIVTSTTEGCPSDKYYVALRFRLTVSQYLKGSGGSSITTLWVDGYPFDTRQEAEDAAPGVVASRDTTWDDREAVLFFSSRILLRAL